MLIAITVICALMIACCVCFAIVEFVEGEVFGGTIGCVGTIGGIIILILLLSSYCLDCNALLEDCSCEPVCCECGQLLPESDKECNRKESVDAGNKCCGSCGQEIMIDVKIDCDHTAAVEVVTAPETTIPEVTEPPTPTCPNCKKGVTSAFCPNCGYDMYATVNCPSCDKEFKLNEAPSYCPDCGEKIFDN